MTRWRRSSQRLIISHFYDLVALALGARSDAKALAADKTVGAVRLAAIKADIVANLDEANLNATVVATRNRGSAFGRGPHQFRTRNELAKTQRTQSNPKRKRSKNNEAGRYPVAHNGLVPGSSPGRPTS
jgi:hypothetical protein